MGSKENIGKKGVNKRLQVFEITLSFTKSARNSVFYQNNVDDNGDVKILQFGCTIRFDGILQTKL